VTERSSLGFVDDSVHLRDWQMKGWSSEGHADDTGHLKAMQMTLVI
jgi:hypothetical protein